MSKIENALYEIHQIEQTAARAQWVNHLHPLCKLIVTVFYIIMVISFPKYDVIGLVGGVIYLIIMYQFAEISFLSAVKKLRVVLPLVCMLGIFNPFLDSNKIQLFRIQMSAGVLSMITLMIKGSFSVFASYLLIATTTVEKLCYALKVIHFPQILVTQFLLTYRYVSLLLEEVNHMTQAYSLRAPNQKGVHFRIWGSLTGQLLLRSIERANCVYESMILRGYRGCYSYVGVGERFRIRDGMYLFVWVGVLLFIRQQPLILIVGEFVGRVIG